MKSILKILAILAGIVCVAVIAVAVALTTLDPNDYKDWIAGKVREKTGRVMMLEGDLKLSYYPWLGVEVNGLTLGNAKGFGDQPFLHIDYLNARVKTVPLLRDRYEIDTVRVKGAVVNLARNKDGVGNWEDLSSGEKKSEPLPLTAVILGGVDIQGARLTWTDAASGAEYRISDLTAATGQLVYGAPINLDVSLAADANQPALNGDLKLNGVLKYDIDAGHYSADPLQMTGTIRGKNVPGGETRLTFNAAVAADLDKDTASVSALKFSLLDTEVTGQVDATNVQSGAPNVEAKLDATGRDLALLFKVLEIEPLATQLADLSDRSFSVSTQVQADLGRGDIQLRDLKAGLLGARLNGELKATNLHSQTPGFAGGLTASGPDLPLLMQVLGQMQGGRKSPLARAGRGVAAFPQKEFQFETRFDADMKSGELAVPKLDWKLLGATFNGELTATNVQTDTPTLKGKFDASGSDLPVLLLVAGQMQGADKPALSGYARKLAGHPDRSFKVKADFNADLKNGNIDVPTLSMQGLGLDLGGNLKASGMTGSGGSVNGQLSLSGEKLRELLAAVDQPDLGDALKSFDFKAGISGTRSKIALQPMALDVLVSSTEIGPKPVKIAMQADTRLNLDKEVLKLSSLSLKGLGLDIAGNIRAEKIMQAPEVSGDINIAPFNLKQFLRQLNQKPPVTADKSVLKKVALKSEFAGSKTGFSLKGLTATLDETSLKGDFSVQNFDKPVTRFGVDIDAIDADRYLAPAPAGQAPRDAKQPAAAVAEEPARIPVDLLRVLDVQGKLKIGKLVLNKVKMRNVLVVVNGKDGAIKLDPTSATLYQGTYDGDIGVDARGKVPKLTINGKLARIQAEPLLKDMNGEAKFRGVANASAALIALGADSATLQRTLTGQMSFSIENGALKGYNLGKIMRQGNSLKESFTLKVSDQEETDFTAITGNPVAKNGVITLDDLKGLSPGLRLSGTGVIADLPRKQMDFKLTATLVATAKGQGGKELQEGKLEGVPLDCRIRGPLADPKRDCDATKLLAALGVKLLKGVIGLPGKLLPGGGDAQPAQEAKPGAAQEKAKDPAKELLDSVKDIFN